MLPGIAEVIIRAETNPIRFEKFCIEICERSEGTTFVATSSTFDRGRDGRSLSRGRGSHAALLCASLNREIDDKVRADMKRLSATSNPDRLIYCSSQALTEDKLDKLSAEMRSMLPTTCSLLALGALQLANLAERFPDILDKYYGPEIRTVEQTLLSLEGKPERTETWGLRLALTAFGSVDARALRQELSKRAVLEVLRRVGPADVALIAETLSSDLRLPKPLNKEYVETVLADILQAELVSQGDGNWQLGPKGEEELASVSPEAAEELLKGRVLIRSTLEELTGTSLTDTSFEVIWSTLLDFFAELFYSKGFSTVRAIDELLADRRLPRSAPSDLGKLLLQGAQRVGALMSNPELAREIEQAVLDMFTERSGPAFEWLARVCERFVGLCALGLESASADEIRSVLRRHRIALDSDIVLTFLCEAEAAHTTARTLVSRCRRLGTKLLLATQVLEEVAYHAWISEHDFQETKLLLGELETHELRRYAENAFVRAFHWHSKKAKDPSKWNLYINQFRGSKPRDYSRLLTLLQADLSAEIVPATFDSTLQPAISDFLAKELAIHHGLEVSSLSWKTIDKARRDGELLASIAAAREVHREAGHDVTIVLLSSSARLREADHEFRSRLGQPNAVLSLGALSYLLSLIPDVSLGAGTLRQTLFEFGDTARLPDADRMALRVIRGTREFDIPWARRRTLQSHLETVLHTEARNRDVPVAKLRKEFQLGKERVHPAQIIAETLRSMAVSDASTTELKEARRTILTLQARVEDLEKQLPKTTRQQKRT